ncbi:MAG: YcxB family protein [Actinomycetota bacterium]|nr:YcxB family protein [Actinomycetota bacterium]
MESAGGDERIAVEIALTHADYAALCRYLKKLPVNATAAAVRKRRIALLPIAAFVGFALALGDHPQWVNPAVVVACGALVLVIRSAQRLLVGNVLAAASGTFVIDPFGIGMSNSGVTTRAEWSGIRDCTLTATHLMVCVGPMRGWCLPVRCFESPEQLTRAHQLITAGSTAPS